MVENRISWDESVTDTCPSANLSSKNRKVLDMSFFAGNLGGTPGQTLSLTVNRALFYGVGMKSAKFLLLPAFALILSGCAGYRVGSSLDKSIRTVSLTIVNKTDEPSIEVAVMKALRAELQMDGRLEVRPKGEADAVLSVTLKKFELHALAFEHKQASLAEEYRMTMTASVAFSKAGTGELLLENPAVLGESEFPYSADLTSSKRGAMPEAASDLARKVVSLVITPW